MGPLTDEDLEKTQQGCFASHLIAVLFLNSKLTSLTVIAVTSAGRKMQPLNVQPLGRFPMHLCADAVELDGEYRAGGFFLAFIVMTCVYLDGASY